MVHRRQVGNETLVFGVHGALLGNAMTWWDHDSGSIWSQPTGEAIAGPRKGQRLELLPVAFTDWETWLTANPDTLALSAPAARTAFDLHRLYIVVDFTSEAAAYPVAELVERTVINDEVAGLEIALVSDPQDRQRWRVFSRRLDDRTVDLALQGGRLVDHGTGSTWDPATGIAVDGELQGQILDQLPALTSFPGDFDTFWPQGRVWSDR